MKIIRTTLSVGAEKPFVILHVSDIHLTQTDAGDSDRRRAFAAERNGGFPYALSAVEAITEHVQKTGYPLINTGDMLDFVTPENLRIARQFAADTGMMMATGNHEYWRCFNDRFAYDDVPATYADRERTLAEVEQSLGIDIRFSCREINGVNLVCLDDSDYEIDAGMFEKLLAVEAQSKPILLFMHIPLYSEHIGDPEAKFSLNAPPRYFENCNPVDAWERSANELTRQICDHIRSCPLIKCVICGHTHRSTDILGLDAQDQLITGCDTIREITVT